MIAEIGAGLGSLKSAYNLAKTLNAANTQVAINDVRLALQNRIFEAREALTAAETRIRELEQQVVELEDWETKKQRYELKNLDRGAFAYVHKATVENAEEPHWLCQPCFEGHRRSILQ